MFYSFKYCYLLSLCFILFNACWSSSTNRNEHNPSPDSSQATLIAEKPLNTTAETLEKEEIIVKSAPATAPIDRSVILQRIAEKVQNKEALIVRVFVPLCDNEYQGIVPVSKALGNGQNPSSNLYWGAMYGLKTYFKRAKQWKLKASERPNNKAILERVIFEHVGNPSVYLIADAYDGSQMKACLQDFFTTASGSPQADIYLDETLITANGHADLVVFNGHNGLMDVSVSAPLNADGVARDAAVIACVSKNYFTDQLLKTKAYPLVMTTQFMAPEAYVLEGIVNHWLQQQSAKKIHLEAAKAYHQYQKCGLNGAKRLFFSGYAF